MGPKKHFSTTAQLYENESGDLAIRFANNLVFEYVGLQPGKGFVVEAMELLSQGTHPTEWRMIPYRKLYRDDRKWHLVSSTGFLDGDETRPALILEVKPEVLGSHAKQYLKTDLIVTLQ